MVSAKLRKDKLNLLFERLKDSYRVIGPEVKGDVIILSEIDLHDIPAGYTDRHGPGTYRLSPQSPQGVIFSFSIGPDSFKRFLHPSVKEIFGLRRSKKGMAIAPLSEQKGPMAFIGMRACDISGLRLLDRVFLEGPVKDHGYEILRRDSMIIAVNCLQPNDNCFCNSMGTGPEVKDGFDIAITELDDFLLLEIGTAKGEELIVGLPSDKADEQDMAEKKAKIEDCKKMMKKSLRVNELPWLIYRNLEHPRWTDVARRCLACGNCTQVCPTCFCSSTYESVQLSGLSKRPAEVSGSRIRTWDSCFSKNFSRVHGGNFRPSRRARYRQWMAHKLAYSIDQFGSPGCVGCGRCITWCPVGIDITEELEALRK
ncbi:MAG: 4Fe-4S dicluster domain-containing protein [Thermodesulfovibrionales bacterium]